MNVMLQNQMKKQNRNPNSSKKEFGDYIIGQTLGQGTFGKVKLATHKHTGENVAIKILEKDKIQDVSDVQRVSRQIHILKLIRHPNIVQLYEIIETPKQLLLIMEFMQNGELFNYIVNNKRIKEQEACKMFHELIDGIDYIHKIGVTHRDLKPENLLLDYKNSLRIVDFGLSNTYKQKQLLKTPCGSPCYAAPQMIKGQKYDGLKVDIWSSGVILFAMVCGFLPFDDQDTSQLYSKILSGKYTFHDSVSDSVRDLINKILTIDQYKRATLQDIRKHPWMQKYKIREDPASGIIVGYHKIPIDQTILSSLSEINLDTEYVSRCLQANRHNSATTAYYLALKKCIKDGGVSSCDIASKSFDKSLIQPNKRRQNSQMVVVDNFFSKTSQDNLQKKRSSKVKVSKQKINITSELKKLRTLSKNKQDKLDSSLNYGYCRIPLTSKSTEKNCTMRRQSVIENKISRKYKEKFNQSLISKSKDKITQRNRINSSVNSQLNFKRKYKENEFSQFMDQFQVKSKKTGKKVCTLNIKADNSKMLKSKRC